MEFKKIKEPVLCGRLAYDSSAEQAVESDILLPDYLPDVTRVLGCRAEPRVISCVGEGRRITVDGMTDVEIFYVSEDGRIRRIEQKLAFSKSVESKNELESPVFILNTRVDYLNCRAVSQRRLDLRGAFTVGIKAAAAVSSDVVSEASGCGIQLKSRTVKSYFPVGESRRQLTLREELEAGRGRAPATGVIRCSARCTAADSRIVAGKIVAKGEVWLHILYDTESDGMQSMDCSLPVSQIIDMEGVSEDSVCDVRFEAVSVEVTPSDGDGAGGFSAEVTVLSTAKVMNCCGIRVAEDAYSTVYPSQTESAQLTFFSSAESVGMHTSVRERQELPGGVAEIKDVWCEARSWETRSTDSGVEAECRIMIRMFALDTDGSPVYYEKASSFVWSSGVKDALCDIGFVISDCSFTRDGPNGVDIRIEAEVLGTVYGSCMQTVLTDISLAEEPRRREPADEAALMIYYADEGEDVWSISKRYFAPVGAVMEENAIEGEVVTSRTMLLIPMARTE